MSYHKKQLASHQIDKACVCFFENDYVSAISLAGCGSSLAKEIHEVEGRDSYCKETLTIMQKLMQPFSKQTPSIISLRKESNNIKNQLKHHNEAQEMELEFDAKFEAFSQIMDGIGNIETLGLTVTKNMEKFKAETSCYDGS